MGGLQPLEFNDLFLGVSCRFYCDRKFDVLNGILIISFYILHLHCVLEMPVSQNLARLGGEWSIKS